MHIKEQDNFLTRIQHALSLPIRARCAELTVLLDRASLPQQHNFFPVLIDNIFGPQGTLCWGLRSTTETQCEDFRQLQHFLSPCGPLFKLIYTLLKDPNIKYEFSLSFLPVKIRQFLEHSSGHPFYSELCHVNHQSKQVMSLLLNPFDYYMFHFAYHLINPWQQRAGSAVTSWNTVYYVLCCDYVIHFLPTEPGAAVQPHIYYNGKNPLQAVNRNLFEQQPKSSGLINTKSLANTKEESFQNNLDVHHPRNDIWRSESVLTIFTDMWLHNNQVSDSDSTLNVSFNSSQTLAPFQHNELPTGEYMRIIRVLIKHLHSFHASAKADDTYMGELKKVSLQMIQGKFYIFLRNLIHRWPLDGSFRLVLELWLSFIQPWRYPPNNLIKINNRKDVNPDAEDINVGLQNGVERDYLPFIAENLLAFVVIFQQLLPRFGRVDLASPKMSLMLYRISKVFDQPNLSDFIREVERCVENNSSPTHKYNGEAWKNNLPPLNPTSSWSTNTARHDAAGGGRTLLTADRKWSAVVRQRIFELEGPNFYYLPLFSDPPAPEVYELIVQIKRSIRISEDLVRTKEREEKELYSGFWGSLKYLFQNETPDDEFTLRDRQKVPMYLQVSLQNLTDMFHITSEIPDRDPEPEPSMSLGNSAFDMSDDMKFLTSERVRSRVKSIKYEGDPDLHPIRSTENAFLVRTLYQVAQKINEIYGPTFYRLYHSPTFWGSFSRELLQPPKTVYKYDKTSAGSPRVGSHLPPRLTLRPLAAYRLLAYVGAGAVAAWAFGYRPETYLVLLLGLFVGYKMARAARRREGAVRHGYPIDGFGNITFDDSF